MAIKIKHIPILKNEAALRFQENTRTAIEAKGSVKFESEKASANAILKKAKL